MSTESIAQIFRFGFVGIVSNLTGYSIFLLITYLGVEPKLAMTVLYFVGATVGFFGNRQWTFDHRGTLLGSSTRYLIAHTLGYLVNLAILFIFVDKLKYPHEWVQGIAIFVVAGYLFIAFKYFVFPDIKHSERGTE